jgi:hypothetical protein
VVSLSRDLTCNPPAGWDADPIEVETGFEVLE